MTRSTRPLALAALSSLVLLAAACPSAAVHRTARVLEQGHSDVALTFRPTIANVSTPVEGGGTYSQPFALPGIVPDFSYHVGVLEHLELGGRISPIAGMAELDAKIRLMGDDDSQFHLALQPALGLQTLFFMVGGQATLPLIATFELHEMVSLTGYTYAKAGHMGDILDLGTNLTMTNLGGGLGGGIELHGDDFYFMPYVDASTTATFSNNRTEDFMRTDALIAGISVGWHGDILHRIEDKIDRLDKGMTAAFEDTNAHMDERFDSLEENIDGIDKKVDGLEEKIEHYHEATAPDPGIQDPQDS